MTMRQITIILIALFVSSVMISQTRTENYIKTTSYTEKTKNDNVDNDSKIETIQYIDGLGRPLQNITRQGGGNKQDIITPVVYDQFGRQAKEYLPYANPDQVATSATLDYRIQNDTFFTTLENRYIDKYSEDMDSDDPNPFSEKRFENSPLNRVLEQGAPGKDWAIDKNHTIRYEYSTNKNDVVKIYSVELSLDRDAYIPTLVGGVDNYPDGELYKTVTKDENWNPSQFHKKDHTTVEFKNKQGQIVLKRTFNKNIRHETYYVYDIHGNLTYVLPPKAHGTSGLPNSSKLNEVCYMYAYDRRNRLVKKKIPGKKWEHIVYNGRDEIVLTQTSSLRKENTNLEKDQWIFTKYDAFGRVAYTGITNNDKYRRELQSSMNSQLHHYVSRTEERRIYKGSEVFYDNKTEPFSIASILTINYYDDYNVDTKGLAVPNTIFGVDTTDDTKGLLTVTRVRVMGTNNFLTTIMGYDNKGRLIYTSTLDKRLGIRDEVRLKLDFMGHTIQSETKHHRNGRSTITIRDYYTYDHMGRLAKHTQKINNNQEELIAENTYDELGQLEQKAVGGNSLYSGLQEVDYTYNIRGWLIGINDVNNMSDDLFSFGIRYNPTLGIKLYNGNISQTLWRTNNEDNSLKRYTYQYDALNRITRAISDNYRYDVYGITYDNNGNIKTLNRRGGVYNDSTNSYDYKVIDQLTYNYWRNSNQLRKVTDQAEQHHGFTEISNSTINDYEYDTDGNMIRDSNKGITSISYNHLNLPVKIDIDNGTETGTITYIYDANGTKLEKKVEKNGTTTRTQYVGDFLYEKTNSSRANLKFFNHPEGYVEPINDQNLLAGFDYVYQYKDHLGNIRLSYSDKNNDGDIDVIPGSAANEIIEEKNYYPFGLEHKGYNNTITGREHNWDFQGQEHTEDLGLNVHEFRWRIHDPAIGRFWQIDPLAEDFTYNSPYAFSENKVISHFELEGLEAVLAITLGSDVKYRGDILERAHSSTQHTNIQSGGIGNFVDAFRNASASDPNGIGFVAIWGHGYPGTIFGSGTDVSVSTSELSDLNDAIKNGDISFTDNAIIYMGNCNAGTCGSGDVRSFAAELSKITGATVIGGNASVGVGPDGSQIENPESMIYWMYNPNVDRFVSFEDGVPTMMDGSTDVIRHLNRAMNPPTSVNSLTPNGITPSITPAPTGTTHNANSNAGDSQFYINLPNGRRIRKDDSFGHY